jgi:16S rRNA processing protein RimM
MSSTPTASGAGADGPSGPAPSTLLVGVVVRPHGLRGELVVDVRTDSPQERFADGSVLTRADARGVPTGALTVESSRPHSGRLLVRFVESPDRDAAESLRGARLLVDTAALPPTGDPDEFHVHQLEGLAAELADGTVVGTVREIAHGPGGELLVLARPDAPDALVPFVRQIVPVVDLDAGRVVLSPPEGLLDLP